MTNSDHNDEEHLADQVNDVFEEAGLADDGSESEPVVSDTAEPESDPTPEADELHQAQEELRERTEDLQRLSAEFANYRRRVERDRVAEQANAKNKVIGELLTLADDLDRAEQHGDLAEGSPIAAFAGKFRNILENQKVVGFGAEGDEFNPDIHEAVQDLSEGDNKVVAAVLRKGYKSDERIIRTAMVVIGDAS